MAAVILKFGEFASTALDETDRILNNRKRVLAAACATVGSLYVHSLAKQAEYATCFLNHKSFACGMTNLGTFMTCSVACVFTFAIAGKVGRAVAAFFA